MEWRAAIRALQPSGRKAGGSGSTRTRWLGGLAVVLLLLTLVDQLLPKAAKPSVRSADRASQESLQAFKPGTSPTEHLRHLLLVSQNRLKIQQGYAQNSVSYAEDMSRLIGFDEQAAPSEAFVRQALERVLGPRVKLEEVMLGAPISSQQESVIVSLRLLSQDSHAMTGAILQLADPATGSLWQALEVRADPNKRLIRLDGTLALLLAKPAE